MSPSNASTATATLRGVGAVEATVKIIGELAWPAVVALAVFVLRAPLGRLLERTTKVQVLGNSGAEFAQQAADAKHLAEAVLPTPVDVVVEDKDHDPITLPVPTSRDEVMALVNISPVAAIAVAWSVVEKAMRQGADPDERFPLMRNTQKLIDRGLLASGMREVLRRLADLRGRAVHAQFIPDADAARDFVDAAWRVASAIDAAHGLADLVPPPPREGD